MTSCRSSSTRPSPTSGSWRAESTSTPNSPPTRASWAAPRPTRRSAARSWSSAASQTGTPSRAWTPPGKVVVVVMDYSKGPTAGGMGQMIGAVYALHPLGVVILSNRDSAGWANRMKPPYRPGVRLAGAEGRPPVVEVNDAALAAVLAAGGVDVAKIRADTSMVVAGRPGPQGHDRPQGDGAQEELRAEHHRHPRGHRPEAQARIPGVLGAHGPRGHRERQAGQHPQRRRRRRLRHGGRGRAGRGVQPARRAPEALDPVHHGERRGEGAVGEQLLRQPPDGAAQGHGGRHQPRHDRPQLAGHHRRDRPRALGPRRDARAR